MKKEGLNQLAVGIFVLSVLVFGFFAVRTEALASGNNGNANLTIWTGGTLSSANQTYGFIYSKSSNDWNFGFYANFTNITYSIMNASQGSALCQVRFNETGTFGNYANATYNRTSSLWQYFTNFTNRGNLTFNFACNSTYGNVSLTDSFIVQNTRPYINKSDSTGKMPTLLCTEDTLCILNLTGNVTEDDSNDRSSLTFSIASNSTLTNHSTVNSTGILIINKTNSVDAVPQDLIFTVFDSSSGGDTADLPVNTQAVNDPPIWQNLTNQSMNITAPFNYKIQATDEENNTPFKLNLTFMSCATAQWSSRNSTNCALFNSSQYHFDSSSGILNISFVPSRDDVGQYTLNFTVTDSGTVSPANASSSVVVNFTVNNANLPPYFTYACDSNRTVPQDSQISCYINVTDIDETNNLTLQALVNNSFGWFTFNSTNTSITTIPVNVTSGFNGSALIKFTPRNQQVGNWFVNITVNDTGMPTGLNSTTFNFSVTNLPDLPHFVSISNFTAYTSNNYTVYINATDDDLLIPDKTVYYEVLNFSSNDSLVSIQSFKNITNTNITMAQITFGGASLGAGMHYVNLKVNDASGNSDSLIWAINVSINSAPTWTPAPAVNFSLVEGVNFFVNLSKNVSDLENNTLTFSYQNLSYFPEFSIGQGTGIINITPDDADVGTQNVIINVSDGISQTPLSFSFTVNNTNDAPVIQKPLSVNINATASSSSNITTAEDNLTLITMNVRDNDFNISQKNYYNESLAITYLNISGPNPNLFNFSLQNIPVPGSSLISVFQASFTPRKSDVGDYNISVNVTDASGLNDSIQFNVTVLSINHAPTLTQVSNQTSTVGRNFQIDLNGSDVEDGNDTTGNLTYSYAFLQGNDFILHNASIFNFSSGLLSVIFNSTQGGVYDINMTLNDTTGKAASMNFWISVYDTPSINSPSANNVFNFTEGITNISSFNVTHSVANNISYYIYLNGSLQYSTNATSAGQFVNWSFTPDFSMETHGGLTNITLTVSNPIYPDLNASRTWSANISHSNAPVLFNGTIPNQQKNYDQTISLNLGDYFSDLDNSDPFYNQTLNFTAYSNATNSNGTALIQVTFFSNLTATFTSSSETMETFNITGNDSQFSNSSNSFTIQFTTPSQTPSFNSGTSSGSGGGGSSVRPVSLNIIVPGPLTARKQDKLIVPISVYNSGKTSLSGIVLRNTIAKNGLLRSDLLASFDKSFIDTLYPGQKENLTLIVDVDTSDSGLYEITLNGTATSPPYSDSAKLYVNVQEGQTVQQKLSFTDELIAQNPQCTELKERVDGARQLVTSGNLTAANAEMDSIIQACQEAIAQSSQLTKRVTLYDQVVNFTTIAAVSALGIGIIYYFYRRYRLQHSILEITSEISDAKI